MRQKRAKAYKRLMSAYSITFGFRQPFQTLLDAEICEVLAKSQMDVEKQLETVLQGKCKPMITQCCIQELYNLGRDGQYVVDLAKRFERRKCNHREPIPGVECLTSVVGTTNPHRYVLATQSETLRNHLRKNVPAVPVMHVKRGVTVMEPMSDATTRRKEELEESTLKPTPRSLSIPTDPSSSSNIIGAPAPPPTASEPPQKKKKTGPKAPNPLSVKKKKKVEPASKKRDSGAVGLGKRKRAGGDEVAANEVDGKAKEAEGDLKVDIVGAEEAVEGAGGAARKKKRRRRGKTGPAGGQDASGEAAGPSTGDDGGNESAGADDE